MSSILLKINRTGPATNIQEAHYFLYRSFIDTAAYKHKREHVVEMCNVEGGKGISNRLRLM